MGQNVNKQLTAQWYLEQVTDTPYNFGFANEIQNWHYNGGNIKHGMNEIPFGIIHIKHISLYEN